MENQKAADIEAIKKIFAQFKDAFTFEQIKSIFLILCRYWQPTEVHYLCEMTNWSKLSDGYKSNDWRLEVGNIIIRNFQYNEKMLEEILQECIKYIQDAACKM